MRLIAFPGAEEYLGSHFFGTSTKDFVLGIGLFATLFQVNKVGHVLDAVNDVNDRSETSRPAAVRESSQNSTAVRMSWTDSWNIALLSRISHMISPVAVRPLRLSRSAVARYVCAVALPLVALATRILLSPWLADSVPLITFFPAIMITAWLAGFGPGVVATVLSALIAEYVWFRPLYLLLPSRVGELVALVMFVAIGVVISVLNELLRRRTAGERAARERAEHLRFEAEAARRATLESERSLRAQVETMARLHALTVRLAETPDMRQALLAVLDTAVRAAGAQFGLLSLYEPREGFLHVWASIGFDDQALGQLAKLTPGPEVGACGKSFATRSRVVVADTETDPLFKDFRSLARAVGFRAVHSTPIVNRSGDTLGVLSVHFGEPRTPDDGERVLADICARYAADAIETGRSHKALVEADRRKDEFIATLAHELRNPLAPILSAVRLLSVSEDRRLAEKSRDVIERQVRQLARLVDDLLDASRITTGKLELRREIIDLRDVIQAAVETSKPLIDAGGHTLLMSMPDEPIWTDGDRTRLAQVFANLLNNAAKYNKESGHIHVAIQVGVGEVETRISDSGIGIPRDRLSDIFELFSQVDCSIERAHGGLGIGLMLVKRLVEMHGGSVAALSDGPQRGSTFVVRLLTVPAPSVVPTPTSTEPAALTFRALVVDDNRDAAETLRDLLVALGSEVEVAFDGSTALHVAVRFRPDVILLDLGMPGMSGYEVAAAVRATDELKGVLLIAVTGWGQESDRQRTIEAGFDAHLVKPPAISDLARLLEQRGKLSLHA